MPASASISDSQLKEGCNLQYADRAVRVCRALVLAIAWVGLAAAMLPVGSDSAAAQNAATSVSEPNASESESPSGATASRTARRSARRLKSKAAQARYSHAEPSPPPLPHRAPRPRGVVAAPTAATPAAATSAPATSAPSEVTPAAQRAGLQPAVGTLVPSAATAATIAAPAPANPSADPLQQRVIEVLDRHCARCHQWDRLAGRVAAEGGLANILSLEEVANTPALVSRGAPDASPLYQQMIARQMPSDILRHGSPGEGPSVEELRAVRYWIERLEPRRCEDRVPLTPAALGEAMRLWLEQAGPQRATDTRFVSLAHLWNACETDAALAGYRQGVAKLLNGLTWTARPIAIETVGETLTLLAVRLSDLGWTSDHWQAITARLPAHQRIPVTGELAMMAGADVPAVAADWLADTAMQPDLYGRLLGLPGSLDDLARILGINLDDGREDRVVRRGVARASAITAGARVIERYPSTRRGLWVAHDYAHDDDAVAILNNPLLPWAAVDPQGRPAKDLPEATGMRALFPLPNGLPAFMLFDRDGNATPSLTQASAPHSQEDGKPQQTVARIGNGASCLACHAGGPLGFEDRLARHIEGNDYAGNENARAIARQIIMRDDEVSRTVAADRKDVGAAIAAAGISAGLRVGGLDPVAGLAARYNRDLDLATAAADMLISGDALATKLATSTGAEPMLGVRLVLGRLSRTEFVRLRAQLAAGGRETASLDTSSVPATMPTRLSASTSQSLLMSPDKARYKPGDSVVLTLTSNASCNLTVINIDTGGKGTVLFPNEFERDNLVKPSKPVRIPGKDAPYQLLLKQAGAEHFLAICEVGEPVPAGIRHDLMHQNFTALGTWEAFVDQAHRAASEPRVPLNNGDDVDRRQRSEVKLRPAPALAPQQWRAAISVPVNP